MDKAELIRHELEKRRDHNLAIGNPLFTAMAEEDIELLLFIDSMQEEPVSDDLEEAANKIVNKAIPPLAAKYKDGTYVGKIMDCFDRKEFIDLVKAGANWQKEQMMKEAVDAKITLLDGISYVNKDVLSQFKQGDKVKVIVIKEG